MILPYIAAEPALEPSPLIVVRPGAFIVKFIPRFEAIDEEIPDVFPRFGKTLYQFLKI